MKTIILILFCCFSSHFISGQTMTKQTLSQHGSAEFIYANNKSYFLQQSIGQASVINTFNPPTYQLRQGFLQPIKATLVNSGFDTILEVFSYPNPFQETINLVFEEPLIDVVTISLYHITGQLIYQELFDPADNLSLRFDNLPNGAFILRGQMHAQSFSIKLMKQ